MKPIQSSKLVETNEIGMTGLVFRENKFASEPVLSFASLALPMPTWSSLLSPTASYLDIDSNQLPCSCHRLGWLLAFGKFGYNSHSLAEVGNTKGSGTTAFIKQLYNTAGPCIECEHRECRETGEDLEDYGDEVLVVEKERGITCGAAGVTIKNYDETSYTMESMATPQPYREVEASSQGNNLRDDGIDDDKNIYKGHNKMEKEKDATKNIPSAQTRNTKPVKVNNFPESDNRVLKTYTVFNSSMRRHINYGFLLFSMFFTFCTF